MAFAKPHSYKPYRLPRRSVLTGWHGPFPRTTYWASVCGENWSIFQSMPVHASCLWAACKKGSDIYIAADLSQLARCAVPVLTYHPEGCKSNCPG